MSTEIEREPLQPQSPRSTLRNQILQRKASLTDVEKVFLSALLIDNPGEQSDVTYASDEAIIEHKAHAIAQASKLLDDDMLFSVPRDLVDEDEIDPSEGGRKGTKLMPNVKKEPGAYRYLVGLWQAHEDGVPPKKLAALPHPSELEPLSPDIPQNIPIADTGRVQSGVMSEMDDGTSAISDKRISSDTTVKDDDSAASWDEPEEYHFDAWQLLKDEYARDFGYDYTPGAAPLMDDDSDLEPNTFRILGTSADDQSAHPHVLSPPLMDSIFNFLPDHLKGQNIWMKYSLVRDGASLDTLKQYARASKNTLLAIETTKGDVFGVYTSQAWRTDHSFYGGKPSFIFKMRYNRNTPCYSLIEQAQMESEIDVYFLLDDSYLPQVCTHELLGVGEGELDQDGAPTGVDEIPSTKHEMKNFGFAIALEEDLLAGTTSKCQSYQNPCLVDPDSTGEPFEVLNLELWTFTPCFSLDSAEKLEMTQFFVSESIRNSSIRSVGSVQSRETSFSARDLDQTEFYRRLGHGDDHSELREQWQYRNMMDGAAVKQRGIGASPRFTNA
eukprot:Nitzschia sp. Nitz4//scaffold20_size174350//59211//60872//NITZ4_002092-RA/size174350-processed-gene-0.19-mRNA-1//1//CDS//3329541779//1821//frame0